MDAVMQAMQESGIGKFIEMGPGQVLQGLIKRTLKDVEFTGLDKTADVEKILNENN
jgi:[acyl-carrier-protein] S-malonyltransferase